MNAPAVHPSTRERRVATNGIELHLVEAGPEDGHPVVLAHGFPELVLLVAPPDPGPRRRRLPRARPRPARVRPVRPARADRGLRHPPPHRRPARAARRHRRRPRRSSSATTGARWSSARWPCSTPSGWPASWSMSVPLLPRGAMPPVQMMRQLFGDSFFYILYFQEPGVADADLGADPAETMTRMLAGPHPRRRTAAPTSPASPTPTARGFVDRLPKVAALPAWLSQAELDHYIAEFSRTGFTGGINWYRNFDRNWETTPQLDGVHVTIPSAFITGSARPREPHEPGRGHGRPRPRPPRQHDRRRAPATGCSRRLPTRSTPPCSRSSARSTSEVR